MNKVCSPVSLKLKLSLAALVVLLGSSLLASALLMGRVTSPTLQSAVFIPHAITLEKFSLLDHQGVAFTNQELLGRWHIVSYGYTFCPDVCPTTLSSLVKFKQHIVDDNQYADLKVLFYSIDYQRDTVEQLAQYLEFFDRSFLGLTREGLSEQEHLGFEKSLGMLSQITPQASTYGEGVYSVSHGFMLYLLNPKGELRAIFKPQLNSNGGQSFNSQVIYVDYRAIRAFLQRSI